MKYLKHISIIIVLFYLIFLGISISTVNIYENRSSTISSNDGNVTVKFFYNDGCGHCEEKRPLINNIEILYGDNITLIWRLYSENKEELYSYGVGEIPILIVENNTNFTVIKYGQMQSKNIIEIINAYIEGKEIETPEAESYLIDTPFGTVDLYDLSLPVLTVLLAAMDSVNPCSFFILFVLLSLLLYVKSRKRMLIIGGIFIIFSGLIYCILMIILLSAVKTVEESVFIAYVAGAVAMVLGAVNIKDFFYFKKGVSASISEDKKKKLFSKMRNLVRIKYLPAMIISTIILAITANTYELACSLGLPVVYTEFLVLHKLTLFESYLYIFFYNIIYVIPLIIIVLIFVITLGKMKLSEYQGRVLKLFSGVMMFSFGEVLVLNSYLLTNIFVSLGVLIGSILISLIISLIWKRIENKSGQL